MKAAKKAGVEKAVRAAALRFLETGVMPFRSPRPRHGPPRKAGGRAKTKARGAVDPGRPEATARSREDRPRLAPARARLSRPDRDRKRPLRPGASALIWEVLLEMAIAAKQPDEVLRWFDEMRCRASGACLLRQRLSYADRVAEAVAASHPGADARDLPAALDAQLPHADYSAYEAAAGYLKKLRPIYKALGRPSEWAPLVASIREKYRNRPRFMELLDSLEGRTIVQVAQSRKK